MTLARPHMLLLLLLFAGCSSNAPQLVGESNMNKLYQREWELQSVMLDNGYDIMHVDAKMTLNFAPGGQVAGFGGVNRIAGSYKLSPDGKLEWASLGIVGDRKR